MVIYIGLILLFIIPILVVLKRRNIKTMLAVYLPSAVFVIFNVYRLCEIEASSEACAWGYLQYIYAFVVAGSVFLIISLGQWLISKFKHELN